MSDRIQKKTNSKKLKDPKATPINSTGGVQFKDYRDNKLSPDRFQDMANNSEVVVQKKNNTGLPDQLKTGIENLSGLAMDDVKVHYNSSKPAQLQAHAYAQGIRSTWHPGRKNTCPMKPGMWFSKNRDG